MKLRWVLSEEIPNNLDISIVQDVAQIWGSWKTWKEYKTNNCICTDTAKAMDLLKHAFHALTNFYIMQDSYTKLGSPQNVKLFNGSFKNNNISNKDDIVALNLATIDADIVLMSGFNFSPLLSSQDDISRMAREEYYFNIRELMKTNSNVQFVLIDYMQELASWAQELENLSFDNMNSVKSLLSH